MRFDQSASIKQQDSYYPFGLAAELTNSSPKNEYLYNKKELQEETGNYDYGAKFYDPVIARWASIDPLAETNRRFSSYVYVSNNPIRFIDPDGMEQRTHDQITEDEKRWADEKQGFEAARNPNISYDNNSSLNIKLDVTNKDDKKSEQKKDGKKTRTQAL